MLTNYKESVSGRGGGRNKLCIARKIQEISERNVILKSFAVGKLGEIQLKNWGKYS